MQWQKVAQRLQTKTTVLVLAIVLLALSLAAAATIHHMNRLVADAEQHSTDTIAQRLAQVCQPALVQGQTKELKRLATAFADAPQILFIAVYDAQARLLASTVRDQQPWKQFRRTGHAGQDFFLGRATVEPSDAWPQSSLTSSGYPPQHEGQVVVGMSNARMLAQQQHWRQEVALVFSLVALICVILFWISIRPWAQRFGRLVYFARSISHGDLEQHLEDPQTGDIGRMATDLDLVRSRLQEQQRENQQLNKNLHLQHAEQTRELGTHQALTERNRRAKSQLLLDFSSQSQASLRQILGSIELLQTTWLGNREPQLMEGLHALTQNQIQELDRLLLFSQLELDQLRLKTAPFDPTTHVRALGHQFQDQYQKQGWKLRVETSDDLPAAVVSDPQKLEQILFHLLTFSLGSEQTPGEVVLSVSIRLNRQGELLLRYGILVRHETGIAHSAASHEACCEADVSGMIKSEAPSQIDAKTITATTDPSAPLESSNLPQDLDHLSLFVGQRLADLLGCRIEEESVGGERPGTLFRFEVVAPRATPAATAEVIAATSPEKLEPQKGLSATPSLTDNPLPSSREPAIDKGALESLRELGIKTGQDVLSRVLNVFLRDTPSTLEEIRIAAQANDLRNLEMFTHSLKGSAAHLGAMRLSALSHTIEQRTEQGDLNQWPDLIKPLFDEYEKVAVAMEEIIRSQAELSTSSVTIDTSGEAPSREALSGETPNKTSREAPEEPNSHYAEVTK